MLIEPSEITVAGLMADLPMQRSARNQLIMQLAILADGLSLGFNPLERAKPIERVIVGENETLPIVSLRLWGKPDYWRQLADANGLEYPFTIYPGQVLEVPEIE